MKDDPLPDEDHIARYCSPSRVENGVPAQSAFEIPPGHGYLSVNWLEYWGRVDLATSLDKVREEFELEVKKDGRFAVLNVADTKETVEEVTQTQASVTHQPTDTMDSHAGVFWSPSSNFDVAAALAARVRPEEMLPAIP